MNQNNMFYGSGSASGQQQAMHQTNVNVPVGSSSSVSNSVNFQPVNTLPQNFVVVSNSCSCSSSGYEMTCSSPSCVNKFHHNPIHLGHQSQQQVTSAPTSNQILTYSLPSSNAADKSNSDDDMLNDLAIVAQSEGEHGEEIDIKDVEEGGHRDDKETRRQRLAEMARLRYQNLTSEEKKAVNSRRMLLRKRKRQREREMEELEAILRRSNDIEEDVVFIGELREKRQRESRAKAARSRYQNMDQEERRVYNQKRRLRQLGMNEEGTETSDVDIVKQQIAQQNARKAELARQRYHRMSVEERKMYNKRRTESLRRRRMEEEALLATPAGQIDAESLQKAQQIMVRNAMRAEKARQRYNANAKRKNPEEPRERKRTRPAKNHAHNEQQGILKNENEDTDILSAIERDVIRRTQEAKQVLEQRSNPNAATATFIKRESLPHEGQIQTIMVNNSNTIQGQTFGHTLQGTPIQVQSGIPGDMKTTTKYIYALPPGAGPQSGFLLPDGQFVALQPAAVHHPQDAIHSYPMESQQFDNNFHHINQGQVHLRPSNAQQAPILIGQRVELIQNPGSDQSTYHHPPNSIHVVNYNHQQQQHATHAPQQQQYITSVQAPQAGHMDDNKAMSQKAKRAERARKRYHEMSAEARHEFNAKRALALKMSRLKDEELCRLGDEIDMTNAECDESLRSSIEQARIRRQKRAESARQKYQKMSPQARREHNAMRDAQRRQRKREMEEGK